MPYEEARDRAWFLTDKMAYELNLTPEQYDRAYEINLNYFMSIRTASDCYGYYWNYRDADFRCILFDWQYNLFTSIDYFFRPIRWVRSSWYYPVCDHYRYGYYYFDRPAIYVTYHGGTWRRRSHNDPSPYRGMHFSRGHGMRDNYRGHRPGADYHRPGRPDGHHRPDGGHRPGDDHKGDRPQANRPGKAMVYAVAPMREAAVLTAGHAADAAIWIDDNTGRWTTSSYYGGLPSFAGVRKQMERNVDSAPQTRSFTIGAKVEF